jgi:hypothetical protein
MSYEEFMTQPIPIRTDPESVARAVRYMEAWLPVGARSIGLGTEDSVHILMQFARERLASS